MAQCRILPCAVMECDDKYDDNFEMDAIDAGYYNSLDYKPTHNNANTQRINAMTCFSSLHCPARLCAKDAAPSSDAARHGAAACGAGLCHTMPVQRNIGDSTNTSWECARGLGPRISFNMDLHYLPISNPIVGWCSLYIAALAPTSGRVLDWLGPAWFLRNQRGPGNADRTCVYIYIYIYI